ncbi:MAG: 50S ribosomal protein L19e [Candidatus ainarchaeum sp.]|nr:50S ribosomal protein L19e [Candidatus ainarchaeum sp.]
MGEIKTIKRLAADILNAGVNRVRIKNNLNENEKKQLDESITRANVRDLIKDKIVFLKEMKGKKSKKEKKNKKTTGKRRGKKYSIVTKKERWMEKVRAQRKYLKQLITEGRLDKENKRIVYLKIKGNSFRSKQAMHAYLEENKMIRK